MTPPSKPNGNGNGKLTTWTVVARSITMIMSGLLVIIGWFINEKLEKIEVIACAMADIEHRVTKIESGESPAVLAKALHQIQIENQDEHADIKLALATLATEIPKDIPPRWFQMQVETLVLRVSDLEKALRNVPPLKQDP